MAASPGPVAPSTRPSRRWRLARALPVATLAATIAVACQPTVPVVPTIPGITVQHTPAQTGPQGAGGVVTITLGTSRDLTVTCTDGDRIAINGTTTDIVCTTLSKLRVVGTAQRDTVAIDLDGPLHYSGPFVDVALAGGADSATVANHGRTWIDGGDGPDLLASRQLLPMGSYRQPGVRTEQSGLLGGPGDDTLNDLGYGAGELETGNEDISFFGVVLDGGPGADALTGYDERPDLITVDPFDTLDVKGGPAEATVVGTEGPDTITTNLNGNYGPIVHASTGYAPTFWFPTRTSRLEIKGGGGDDRLDVSHRSSHAFTYVTAGAGTDTIVLAPSLQWVQSNRSLTMPSPWLPMIWDASAENVNIGLMAQP